MNQFCPKCGWLGEEIKGLGIGELVIEPTLPVECPDCKSVLERTKEYWIPIYDRELDRVYFEPISVAQRKLKSFPERYFPVPDNDTTFNIKINGEWNGIPIGRKIQEKNESLKRKVSGYEHEQRNVRADVERQLKQKIAKQNTK